MEWRPAARAASTGTEWWKPAMADLVFVLLSVGVFAVLALIVRGVERL
ncbi:MAG TPA: hypothetical protein VFP72_17270 [Kineosporiaceae bacterium]|nr:hypothetical protein [Kineosporiaceae bacterium]